MNIKIENVIWQFAKIYRKQLNAERFKDEPIGMNIAAVATFQALMATGNAHEEVDAEGNSIWRATPKFLRDTGLESGPLVTFGPDVQYRRLPHCRPRADR